MWVVPCKVRVKSSRRIGPSTRFEEGTMVQVVRIGSRVLYLREGCVVTYRQGARMRDCVLRELPDHEGRALVEVDGKQERVLVADLVA
jgi:hypothetical protein